MKILKLTGNAIYGTINQLRFVWLFEFSIWFENQTVKGQKQIKARLARIQDHLHFGEVKDLGGSLAELKWKNGRRIYFTIAEDDVGNIVFLIMGGNKNGQSKDIAQARKTLSKIQSQ